MTATIILEGRWKLSKQNSYLARPHGGKYKNPKYVAEQQRLIMAMRPQLIAQGWKCTKNRVALNITFYGPTMPIDWDNCGVLTDAMQGKSVVLGHKRYRIDGLVVVDDKQFVPVTVNWHKDRTRKIIIDLKEMAEAK